MELRGDDAEKVKMLEYYQHLQWYVEVKKIEEGGAFGELALLESNEPNTGERKATIMCLTDCYFATIDKESYNRVLAKEKVKEQKMMVEFLRQLPFIRHWTKRQLEKLVLDFHMTTYTRNQVIFRQG